MINKELNVADIVKSSPVTAKVFYKHHIDFCCGGKIPLEKSCEKNNVDLSELLQDLNESIKSKDISDNYNYANASEVIDDIMTKYHNPLYETLPILQQLGQKVSQVHGESEPELIKIYQNINLLINDLISHMEKEEKVLFPMIKRLEKNRKDVIHVEAPIQQMEHEHEDVADILVELKKLTNNFTPPLHACNSYRGLFALLKEIEFDLYEHIFIENNILHPMAASMNK